MLLDAIGQEAENGTNPQQEREATKQLFAEFGPLWGGVGRSQYIGSISNQDFFCLFWVMALCGEEMDGWKAVKTRGDYSKGGGGGGGGALPFITPE